MIPEYNFKKIETEAQEIWEAQAAFKAVEDPDKEKFYCLAMFPYPSGKLHMGHVRNYTITDVISRFQRMNGKNVLHPMGWDAFGLPAENAAIQNNTAPAKWTYSNIDYMKEQLNRLGFGFDWSRELATCQPNYYRWEQWFFTRLYERGLAYRKKSKVNWCPNDQTVLANEQVVDGLCWRCDSPVESREIPQWFIRITEYAEQLLSDLDDLPDWPPQVVQMQRNWIGKSRGVEIEFDLQQSTNGINSLSVYTTRPDTLMGATYLAIAPEHSLSQYLAETDDNIASFIAECSNQTNTEAGVATLEKRGCATTLQVEHPLTGDLLPVWIANFVLMEYGHGAVMSVPAHDQRDWEFARKYRLPIKPVVSIDKTADSDALLNTDQQAYTGKGLLINSGVYNGLPFEEAFDAIATALEAIDKGQRKTNYRLRDWGVSRQRYWGAPIPILNLANGEDIAVPAGRLPVLLPEDVVMDGINSPIKQDASWRQTDFDGQKAEHETDTFDTFMESSWYYARYTCPDYDEAMLDKERANYWLPVDQYVGGIEHAILHLLYARFFHKLMRDEGLIDSNEPFKKLLCQGMVLANSYCQHTDQGKIWYKPEDVNIERDEKGRVIAAQHLETGVALTIEGMTKMSKSKNNGVDPQQAIEQYGADSIRLFIMFAAPPEQTLEWSEAGLQGAHRFLRRLWTLTQQFIVDCKAHGISPENLSEGNHKNLQRKLHETIRKVTDDYQRRQTYNTAIAAIMELVNEIKAAVQTDKTQSSIVEQSLTVVLQLLSPIAPHVCRQLLQDIGRQSALQQWPEFDPQALLEDSKTYVIQVNGKLRSQIEVAVDTNAKQIEQLALDDDKIKAFIDNQQIVKVIVVPNKLVNIVVR